MIADYVTKHHTPVHSRNMRKFYVHTKNTPKFLNVSPAPHILRGCVKPNSKGTRNLVQNVKHTDKQTS